MCPRTEYLNAHHIVPRENKEWKYSIDNGITLCVKHHKFGRRISAHCNPFAFLLWLEENRPEMYALAKIRNIKAMKDEIRQVAEEPN